MPRKFLLASSLTMLGGAIAFYYSDCDVRKLSSLCLTSTREAEALSKHDIGHVAYDENKFCTVNKIAESDLAAKHGTVTKEVTLFHLYDGRNELHN